MADDAALLCAAWFEAKDDARLLRRLKGHVLAGHSFQLSPSVLHMAASAPRLPGLPIFRFLIAHGAPITFDAFLTAASSGSRLDAPGARVRVLQLFIDLGCDVRVRSLEFSTAVRLSRGAGDVHAFLLALARARACTLKIPPGFFDPPVPSDEQQLLAELALVDTLRPCHVRQLLQCAEPALWKRVLSAVRDADVLVVENLPGVQRADRFVALLNACEPAAWSLEQRELALSCMLKLTHGVSAEQTLAVVFARTGLAVDHAVHGRTPLAHVVALRGSLDAVAWLVARGANANAVGVDGNAPLHLSRDAAVDALLVRAGADPTLRNRAGQTALDLIDRSVMGDVERHWFFAKQLPVLLQHRRHAELLEICIALAPLLHELPPEIADRILAQLPGMSELNEGMRYSLFVRVGAAHANKLDGAAVHLPARERVELAKPVAVAEVRAVRAPRASHPLQMLLKRLNSPDVDVVLEAVVNVRRLLSVERNPPIDDVIEVGFLAPLVALAMGEHEQIAFEADWALSNVCSGTTRHVQAAVNAGCLAAFMRGLTSNNAELVEQAQWGLSNCAADSVAMRDLLLRTSGLFERIVLAASAPRLSMQRNLAWLVSNLVRGKPAPDWPLVARFVPLLEHLVHVSDESVLADTAWSFACLSACSQGARAIAATRCAERLAELVFQRAERATLPAVRVLADVLPFIERTSLLMTVIAHRVMPTIQLLLSSPKRAVRKQSLYFLCNALAAGLVEPAMHAVGDAASMFHDAPSDVAHVLANFAHVASPAQIDAVVGSLAITYFMLQLDADDEHVLVALEFFQSFLLKCERAKHELDHDTFVELCSHDNKDIAAAARAVSDMLAGKSVGVRPQAKARQRAADDFDVEDEDETESE